MANRRGVEVGDDLLLSLRLDGAGGAVTRSGDISCLPGVLPPSPAELSSPTLSFPEPSRPLTGKTSAPSKASIVCGTNHQERSWRGLRPVSGERDCNT